MSAWLRSRAHVCAHLFFALVLLNPTHGSAQPFDVPYVPTPQVVVDEMLRLANVGPDDFVIDLGCGDGRIPVTAAAYFGARALGKSISFIIVDNDLAHRYEGTVEGRIMQGVVRTGAGTAETQTPFRAVWVGSL